MNSMVTIGRYASSRSSSTNPGVRNVISGIARAISAVTCPR